MRVLSNLFVKHVAGKITGHLLFVQIMTVHVSSMGSGSHQKEEDSILRRNYKKTLTEKNVTGQVFEFIYKLRGTDFKEWRL